MIIGAVLRSLGMTWSLFVGTCVIGIGTTCSNLVVTMLVVAISAIARESLLTVLLHDDRPAVQPTAASAFHWSHTLVGGRGGSVGSRSALICALVACLAIYPLNRAEFAPSLPKEPDGQSHADDSP